MKSWTQIIEALSLITEKGDFSTILIRQSNLLNAITGFKAEEKIASSTWSLPQRFSVHCGNMCVPVWRPFLSLEMRLCVCWGRVNLECKRSAFSPVLCHQTWITATFCPVGNFFCVGLFKPVGGSYQQILGVCPCTHPESVHLFCKYTLNTYCTISYCD